MIKLTYYTEVISSWCYWAEPAWSELKTKFAGKVEFHWKIALLGADGLPASQMQEEWFYRRSGTVVRSPFMLRADWLEPGLTEYLVPNLVAEAAKDLGVTDDRVRLALAHAAMREGRKVNRWEEALPVAARAASLNETALKTAAQRPETEHRVRTSTAAFHALQLSQRPAFVVDGDIGDKAVFSGIWVAAPIAAAIEAMIADQIAYESWKAHFGNPPSS